MNDVAHGCASVAIFVIWHCDGNSDMIGILPLTTSELFECKNGAFKK